MIRVLVVDDDFMVARIHARFVDQTDGFEVVGTAHHGADALRLVGELGPDLVLLDVHLPDLSGLEVLERLRLAGQHVAVVMVTAERGAEAVRAALHGGAMQYLVKPFEYADLAERLREVAATLDSLEEGDADQATIDRAFGVRAASPQGPGRPGEPGGPGGPAGTGGPRRPGRPAPMPKGLSPETAALVLEALGGAADVSASEAGEAVGLSRVTARRYLERFVETGQAEVRLQYGLAGRPERRYRLPGAGRGRTGL